MSALSEMRHDFGSTLIAVLLAVVLGVGGAVGVSVGLVSIGSGSSQVTKPLVTYNAP